MPHFDTPEPVQNHPVTLTPPSLRNLSGWGWLALAVVVVSSVGVAYHVSYSVYHSISVNSVTPLPRYSPKTNRTKKAWRSIKSRYSQPIFPDTSTELERDLLLHPPPPPRAPYSNIPHLAVPSPAMSPLAKKRTTPMYDTHNIRFASPSNAAIYNNPKLAPVQGSAVPLSYDSHDNLFANPFTPAPAPRDTSYRGHWAFRRNDKGKSRSGGKENLSGAELEEMPMKRLF